MRLLSAELQVYGVALLRLQVRLCCSLIAQDNEQSVAEFGRTHPKAISHRLDFDRMCRNWCCPVLLPRQRRTAGRPASSWDAVGRVLAGDADENKTSGVESPAVQLGFARSHHRRDPDAEVQGDVPCLCCAGGDRLFCPTQSRSQVELRSKDFGPFRLRVKTYLRSKTVLHGREPPSNAVHQLAWSNLRKVVGGPGSREAHVAV